MGVAQGRQQGIDHLRDIWLDHFRVLQLPLKTMDYQHQNGYGRIDLPEVLLNQTKTQELRGPYNRPQTKKGKAAIQSLLKIL